VADLNGYLAANSNSQESRDFGMWVVGFIIENTDVNFTELVEMNSIPNSTITLHNIIDVTNLADYPAFKSMVENLPAFLNQNPEVLKSLSRYTGFSKTKIMQLMQPGKGPKVELVSNLTGSGQPAFGQYTPGTYILKINKELVIGLDKVQSPNRYRALGMLLAITTLHEFVHYGRDVNKLTSRIPMNGTTYEAGLMFELSISPLNNYQYINRNNAIEWANFYKFNIND
jgi:Metallopeptidase toxin 3